MSLSTHALHYGHHLPFLLLRQNRSPRISPMSRLFWQCIFEQAWVSGLTTPPRLPHVDGTTPSETYSPRGVQDGANGMGGGASGRMTGECSEETRASFHILPTNTLSHGLYKSVPSCPLLFSQSPIHLSHPATLTSAQTLACSATTTNSAFQSMRPGLLMCCGREQALGFGVSGVTA